MEKFHLLRDHLIDRGLTTDAERHRPDSLQRRPSSFDYIACYMAGELSYENPRRKGLAKPGVTEDDK